MAGEGSSSGPSGLLGLDRRAMEEARLARQAKRNRSISPPARSPRKAAKLDEKTVTFGSGAQLRMFSSMVENDQQSRKPEVAKAAIEKMKAEPSTNIKLEPEPDTDSFDPESLPHGAIKYPNGVVKKTWAFGHERTGHDIKLEEVLEPRSVKTALLSAFQWDVDWVFSKLNTPLKGGNTKCIFVMQAKGDEERARMREVASERSSFLRLCLPPMDGLIWCMHSKLMLLFHPEKLRVAIPTANLLNFDWGETGQMENSVFMIDLPRLAERCSAEDLTPFGKSLMYFLGKQGVDDDVKNGVLGFDFSATAQMAFVHTVGGVHFQDHAQQTGLLGLSKSVRELGFESTRDLEIDFAASSIGSLNEKYLQDLHSAACGIDSIQHARDAKSKAGADFFKPKGKGNKAEASSSTSKVDVKDKMRIYFPTHETVRSSTAGAAGTICLQRNYFEAKTFPKECFRDYRSTRVGLLSHNKILLARGKKTTGEQIAWAYVGSANMSKSAWGELPADRTDRKITCRNWECGVLLPVNVPKAEKKEKLTEIKTEPVEGHEDSETEDEEEDADGVAGLDVFEASDVLQIPFKVPGSPYNGKQPYYFKEDG